MITPIPGTGATPFTPPTLSASSVTSSTVAPSSGSGFAGALNAVSNDLAASDTAAANVATGTGDIATMTAAMTKSSVDMQLTVAVRDKAVAAYQQIMQMQV